MSKLTKTFLSLFTTTLSVFTLLLGLSAQPTEAVSGYSPIGANQLADEIDFFLGEKNASGYLMWQYSGNLASGEYFENDKYSFFQEDGTGVGTICGTLKEKSAQYGGKFVGVNFWSATKPSYSQAMVQEHLNWLKSNCGVNMVRVFAYAGSTSPADAANNSAKVKAAAEAAGVRVIWTIGDYSNGGGGVPKGAGNDWYTSNTPEFNSYLSSIISVVKGSSSTYGIELSNEAHCGDDSNAINAYNSWVSRTAQIARSAGIGNVGIGQMASQANSACDHPNTNFAQSNSQAGINMASGHYYNQEERDQVSSAADISPVAFYIGEAGWGGLTTKTECTKDNCKDCTIDPNDPFGTGVLICPLEVPGSIIFDQYKATCNSQEVSIVSNGNTEICLGNNECIERSGEVRITESPELVDNFLDEQNKSRANVNNDYQGKVTNNDTTNALNTAAIYKLNSNAANFDQIKSYLTAMMSCQDNYDQPGCFPPKYILPSGIAEDDFVRCIGGIGGLTSENYRQKLDKKATCSTDEGSIMVNLLEVWSSIDYNIMGCMPAFRVKYTKAPPPDPGVWGWFNALFGVSSDQPALSIEQYLTCNAGITPFSFGQVQSSVNNMAGNLLPAALLQQTQTNFNSQSTAETIDPYLNGPIIFNLDKLGPNNVTTQTIAAKVNRDGPSCNSNPNTDSSDIITAPAEPAVAEAIFERDSTPPNTLPPFQFIIDLFDGQTGAPHTATYLSADIIYTGTTEKDNLALTKQAFTPAALIEQDTRDDLDVEFSEISNTKAVESDTIRASKTTQNPDPSSPPTTETVSFNAQTSSDAPKSRAHISLANTFGNFLSITSPAIFNVPRCVIAKFGAAFRGEALTNCVSGQTGSGNQPPTQNSQINCTKEGDPGYVPDSSLPQAFQGETKTRFIDLATRWTKEGQTNAAVCYNDVVSTCHASGINPYFCLTIWLNESGASNYSASKLAWQDFGINDNSIAENFRAQLTRFISTTKSYATVIRTDAQFGNCAVPGFSYTQKLMCYFHWGPNNTKTDEERTEYYNAILGPGGVWELVTGGCGNQLFPPPFNACWQ